MIPLDHLRPFPADSERPSPNHTSRRGTPIRWVIFHATADSGNEEASLEWLTARRSNVSAHLFVRRDGTVIRLVDDERSAWHAGVSRWPQGPTGIDSLNIHTIGVEFANRNDGEPLTDAQYQTAARIAAWYVPQGLDLKQGFLAHYHVSPGRKTDPKGFDWKRFNKLASDRIRRLHPTP